MASLAPTWAYMQQFPARGARDRTNLFGVFFDDCNKRSVNNLRDLFASEFKPISSKPDSFLVWKQKTGSEHGLTFFIVDMDQIEVEDFVKGSISLEEIIKSEDGFVLRQNNRDSWIGIEWPCECGQEHSPFPSFQQTPGSLESIPVPGQWHNPNGCNGQHARGVTSIPNDTDGAGTFGYTPIAKRRFLPTAECVMTPRLATVASPAPCGPVTAVASSAYAPEDASAASPTGKVIYAARFRDPASSGATYKAIPPPSTYTASPPKSPYEALVPQAAHKVLAAAMTLPTGGVTISPHLASTTLQTPHMANTASPMSRLFDAPAATSAIRRLPTDTSVRLAYHRHQDINHSLINMDDDNARYQGEHEEHEPFVRSEQILNHS